MQFKSWILYKFAIMKVTHLTLLVVSIVVISSMAQEVNQSVIDQEKIEDYKIAERIAIHQKQMV